MFAYTISLLQVKLLRSPLPSTTTSSPPSSSPITPPLYFLSLPFPPHLQDLHHLYPAHSGTLISSRCRRVNRKRAGWSSISIQSGVIGTCVRWSVGAGTATLPGAVLLWGMPAADLILQPDGTSVMTCLASQVMMNTDNL